MTKQTYIDRLVEIGYGRLDATNIVEGIKWSMVKIQDTVTCMRMIYDVNGKRI